MRSLFSYGLLVLLGSLPVTAADSVMIVYDASGSMWGQVEGRAKVEIARQVLKELLDDWPADQAIGLTAYGHREKGNCRDIEVLVSPGQGSAQAVAERVHTISPKGKTPLTEAVRQAAESLRYTEDAATVILISDGEETCNADPCAVGAELAMNGVDFTTHVIGFDVPEEDRAGLECLAARTGGRFLAAGDAAELASALDETVAEAQEEAVQIPIEDPGPATLDLPSSVPAGAAFEVAWTGPDGPRDFLTIVAPDARDTAHGHYEYTKKGTPVELRASDVAGTYEVRYVFNPGRIGRQVLVRQSIEVTPVEASLEAATTAPAGSKLSIEWTGPGESADFITIVAADTPEKHHDNYRYTKTGNPVEVLVPIDAGDYEIRYVTGRERLTLARRGLVVEAAPATLNGPSEVAAGATFAVEWTGPDNAGDFVTIVPADANEGRHVNFSYTKKGSPAELRAPDDAGSYQIRYVTSQDRRTLSRVSIEVTPVGATFHPPERAAAGSEIELAWEGPDNPRDFITVVPADAPEKKHLNYTYTREGSPMSLRLPDSTGPHEIRYVMAQSRRTLARQPIELYQIPATLDAPSTVAAGASLTVHWTGPGNFRDFITLVEAGTPEKKHGSYKNTSRGNPLEIKAPSAPGEYELRYVTGQSRETIVRMRVRVE